MIDLLKISSLMRTAGLARCAGKVEDLAQIREDLIKERLYRSMVKGMGYPVKNAYKIVYEPETVKELDLGLTKVSDVSPLSGLTNLRVLCLNGTKISDISLLSGLTNLDVLDLGLTKVSDVSPLSGLTKLEWLGLRGTKISDISPLSGLTKLRWLNLHQTKVKDLSSIRHLINNGLKVYQ